MNGAAGSQIILASASPRRRELLSQIGVSHRVIASAVEEKVLEGENAGDFVCRMAREKATDVASSAGYPMPVLGADTAVVLDSCIMGKPANRREAAEMLGRLSGRTHEVYSAIALVLDDSEVYEALNISRVTFGFLDREWIEAYCDTGDPMDKAGAYGVQGKAGEKISRIEGSFYGVMGLPLFETAQLLRRAEVIF